MPTAADRPTKQLTSGTSIEDAERIYEQVKAKLTRARIEGVERAKANDGHYGHDLFAAIRAADRAMDREAADEYLHDTCGDNLFKALSLILDAHFDSDVPLRSSETRNEQALRALQSEIKDLDRTEKWANERKAENGLG